jgi:hypothetical protein
VTLQPPVVQLASDVDLDELAVKWFLPGEEGGEEGGRRMMVLLLLLIDEEEEEDGGVVVVVDEEEEEANVDRDDDDDVAHRPVALVCVTVLATRWSDQGGMEERADPSGHGLPAPAARRRRRESRQTPGRGRRRERAGRRADAGT